MNTLISFISYSLQNALGSRYFNTVNKDGDTITIRVSDHRSNPIHNSNRTLSFITKNEGNAFTQRSNYEWVIDPETMEIVNDYGTITDILNEFEINPEAMLLPPSREHSYTTFK